MPRNRAEDTGEVVENTDGVAKNEAEGTAVANTHIRFVGSRAKDEDPATVVFGKRFTRDVWVPIANLDGSNPEKKALAPDQLTKLMGNPAFELGDGENTAASTLVGDQGPAAEEA